MPGRSHSPISFLIHTLLLDSKEKCGRIKKREGNINKNCSRFRDILLSKPVQKKRDESVKSWGLHNVKAYVSPVLYDVTQRHCNQFKTFRARAHTHTHTHTQSFHLQGSRGLRSILHSHFSDLQTFNDKDTKGRKLITQRRGVISQEHRALKSVEVHAQKFDSGGVGLGPWRCRQLCRLQGLYKSYSNGTNVTTSSTILYSIQQQMWKKHISWQEQ